MKTTKMLAILVLVLGLATELANADFIFGTPTKVPNVNSSSGDDMPNILADGLKLYFESDRPGGYGSGDLWVATRPTKDDPWGEPVNLGPPVNSSTCETAPSVSADDLELYFCAGLPDPYMECTERPGGYGGGDLWVSTRETTEGQWGTPLNLGSTVNSSSWEGLPNISTDGLSLYFCSDRPGGYGRSDLYVTTRTTRNDSWRSPVNLGSPINSGRWDMASEISADGLLLFLGSGLVGSVGGYGWADIWVTTRATTSDPWGELVNLGPNVNSSIEENGPTLSADGSTLYFCRGEYGQTSSWDLWQVSITPVVDLNDDGIVDVKDVLILTDHWGTDETLCDIGPMPMGDGIVDVRDLLVLAEYIEPEVRALAFWALDESEGILAQDSAGENDAYVFGGPVWQPTGGKVGGALQFDGVDDYVSTPFILDPAKGSFSAFAWIKGGKPGQVIISQTDGTGIGTRWLWVDPSYGRLLTWLMHPPFDPLLSESVITDGQWHQIGLVYDFIELRRYLYVDGAKVAQDTTFVAGEGSDGGLYIGAGKSLVPNSFFSGLIDDVRIYRRALNSEEIAVLAQ